MDMQDEILALRSQLGVLQDKDEIRELQYAYGYFIDNRMFREMADLFADQGAWMEIGNRGRYLGKERIHDFLLQVLGNGRWGLLRDEVINHVQQQMIITIDADRQHARARSRAQVQGNSPPDTPHFLLADGIYENQYVREGGRWKILGITVTMTYYAALVRDRIEFATAPPSETLPADLPSQPTCVQLGRQFNAFHFRHPVTGKLLPTPHS
jgi:SnoaL-like domain